MSERPHKRQRIANPFIDIEAEATDDEESDVEEDQYHSIEEEMSDVDEVQREEARHQLHLLFEREDERRQEQEDEWAGVIERANARAKANDESELAARARLAAHDAERGPPLETDKSCYLWEIGCKTGSEEKAVFEIYTRATHPDASQKAQIVSVIGRSDIPGRIYVEIAATGNNLPHAQRPIVETLAQQVEELHPRRVRLLRPEELEAVLKYGTPTHQVQSWVRFLGPPKKYKNDIGLLVDWENNPNDLCIFLIPRISFSSRKGKEKSSNYPRKRSPAQLLDKRELERRLGIELPRDRRGQFKYKNDLYSSQGFLIIRQHSARLAPSSQQNIPPPFIWDIFQNCPQLEEDTRLQTSRKIARSSLALHNRVKILRGPFRDLCGLIRELSINEANIHLYSQGINVDVSLDDIRQAFEIGDYVLVFQGEHRNMMGWVVQVSPGRTTICNASSRGAEGATEVNVPVHDVKFFDHPETTTLHVIPPGRKKYYMNEFNPHHVHRGKRAQIVSHGNLKGYKGFIRDTSAQGDAWIDVDAHLQFAPRTVKLRLDQLVPLRDDDKIVGEALPIIHTAASKSIVQPPTPFPPPETPRTPMPEASGSATPSSAWYPTSLYEVPGRAEHHPAWLCHPALSSVRFKLVDLDRPAAVLEFSGMESPHVVVVRLKTEYIRVPLTSIRHLRPTCSEDQVVVVTEGPRFGMHYRIITYGADECVIRKRGVRKPTKAEPNIRIPTSDLAQVYPILR